MYFKSIDIIKRIIFPLKRLLLIIFILSSLSFKLISTRTFTSSEGLIDERIIDIKQDSYGQLWVVSENSIMIFNGSNWVDYLGKLKSLNKKYSSEAFRFKKLQIDKKNYKYLLTEDGRVLLLRNDSIDELQFPLYSRGIRFEDIELVNENNDQILWASTNSNGLAYYLKGWFTFQVSEGLISNNVLKIKSNGQYLALISDKGIQYIKDRRVVFSFQTSFFLHTTQLSLTFDKYNQAKDGFPSLLIFKKNRIYSLINERIEDRTYLFYNPYREYYQKLFSNGGNKIYLTDGGSLKIVDLKNFESVFIRSETIQGKVNVIYQDDERNLWVGKDNGLLRLSLNNVNHYDEKYGLFDRKIISTLNFDGDFYFGHENGKITFYSKNNFYQLNFESNLSEYSKKLSNRSNDITKIFSSGNKVFIKVGDWGIFEILSRYKLKPIFTIESPSDLILDCIAIRDNQIILVGSFQSKTKKENLIFLGEGFNYAKEKLTDDLAIKKIYLSRDGSLWLAANDSRLVRLSKSTLDQFDLRNSFGINSINSIREDRGSNLFIGTDNGFIIIMKTGELKHQVLSSEKKIAVHSFFFDELNNVWLNSDEGLRFWNWKEFKRSNKWKKFFISKESENSINEVAGNIFISGSNGLFVIPSDEEEIFDIKPRVYITEVSSDGLKETEQERIVIKKAKELIIKYNAVMLSSNNMEFSYKLDGFDVNWSEPTFSREVKYVNLPAGKYRFLVRSRIGSDSWTEPVSTNLIEIRKPFYLNYPIILLIFFSLTTIILLYLLIFTRRKEPKSNFNQLQSLETLEKQNKQLRQEINKALALSKSRMTFLASLSHELRTPVNSIIGFVDILLESNLKLSEEERTKYLNYISVNGRRLLILINDIIDLAKIDSGIISLEFSDVNLNAEVRDTINLFREKIKAKQLDLILELDPEVEKYTLSLDRNRLHQILSNLITNAIKFTEEGFIKISTRKDNDKFYLIVEDTGIGIPADEINFIFDEFRRASTAIRKSIEGTGLGLSITKRLVELMNGNIYVESQEEVGTTFTVVFHSTKNQSQKKEADLKNLN